MGKGEEKAGENSRFVISMAFTDQAIHLRKSIYNAQADPKIARTPIRLNQPDQQLRYDNQKANRQMNFFADAAASGVRIGTHDLPGGKVTKRRQTGFYLGVFEPSFLA